MGVVVDPVVGTSVAAGAATWGEDTLEVGISAVGILAAHRVAGWAASVDSEGVVVAASEVAQGV